MEKNKTFKKEKIVFGFLMILSSCFFFWITACQKESGEIGPKYNLQDTTEDQSIKSFHVMKVNVKFKGFLRPQIGDEVFIETYLSDTQNPNFGAVAADITHRMVLTEDQVENGFTVLDTIPENTSYVYVSGYVDIDGDGTIGKGDLAVFYNQLNYDSTINGNAFPENVNDQSSITLNINKVKGYNGNKHPISVKIKFTGDKKPVAGDKLVVNGYYLDNEDPDFQNIVANTMKDFNLTQGQIDTGLVFNDSVLNTASYIYVNAYADIDGNGALNLGDLAAFYDNMGYDSVMEGSSIPKNIYGQSQVEMELKIVYGLYGIPIDINMQFSGERKPLPGDEMILNLYYPGSGTPDFKVINPSKQKKINLTASQINNGFIIKDTIPYGSAHAFVSTYVDIDGSQSLNEGDLVAFYNNKNYENIINGDEQPEDVKGETDISIDLNRVKGYGIMYAVDYDGNLYHTVKIGSQIWMVDNLRVKHYRNGDPIPTGLSKAEWTNATDGAYAVYPYNETDGVVSSESEMIAKYGLIYNAFAVNDSRNIAPDGWRVATDDDWKELEMHAGMTQSEADGGGYRASPVANRLKTKTGWKTNSGTDTYGFSIIPAGDRTENGDFTAFGTLGGFWTSSQSATHSDRNIRRYIKGVYGSVGRGSWYKPTGYSVRCIKE